MTPNLDYLRKVERGDIIVRVEWKHGNISWQVTDGVMLLRLHEEAGLVEPMYTARWAGYPQKMQDDGVPAKLTDAGKLALGQGGASP